MFRKIKCCIVGAGGENIATNHQLPASLVCPSVKIIALADINEKVTDYAKRHNLRAYLDFAAMLRDPEIEMVQIATPDWVHCEQAVTALEAGKYVLLQKPPCLNFDELRILREHSARHPDHLKILLNDRETRLARTLRHCVDSGMIGELRAIRIKYRGRRFPIGNPASPYLKATCGGVWLHNGLHWLDEACAISGKLPSAVQAFTARNDNGRPEFLGEGPNYWSALFDLEGINFLFEYNTMLLHDGFPGGLHRAFIGTQGELRVNYGSSEIILYENNATTERVVELLPPVHCETDPTIDSFCIAVENFARQIIDGKTEGPSAEHSLFLMEALLSAPQSAMNGSKISIGSN